MQHCVTYLFFVNNVFMIYCLCCIFLIFLTIIKIKKPKVILKTNNKYRISKKAGIYYTKQLNLNFFEYKNYQNKLRQLMLIDHIISCVKYASPTIYNKEIDYIALKNFGIDIKLPVLYFDFIDNSLLMAITIAKQYCNFNAITSDKYFDKKTNYLLFLDKEFCSLNLFTSIMSLNVFSVKKFKVVNNGTKLFEIKVNDKELNSDYAIFDNKHFYKFIDSDAKITISKFNDQGEYVFVTIKNLIQKTVNTKIDINFNLNKENYFIKHSGNRLTLTNTLTKNINYLICSKNVEYNIQLDRFINPKLQIRKEINVPRHRCVTFCVYFGDSLINKNTLFNSQKNYSAKLEGLLNIRIKSKNVKLNYLINYYLIKKVTSCSYLNLYEKEFDIVYNLFKKKAITALDFYMWLKMVYLGIEQSDDRIKVHPICKFDFEVEIRIDDKKLNIEVKHSKQSGSCIIVDNIKYHNINVIPYNQILNCKKLFVLL